MLLRDAQQQTTNHMPHIHIRQLTVTKTMSERESRKDGLKTPFRKHLIVHGTYNTYSIHIVHII